MYAEAAVDGSEATIWAPDAASASLTVDLGRSTRLKGIAVHWTDVRPASSRIETSLDGSTWTAAAEGSQTGRLDARYVRVSLTRSGEERTGIRELIVTG